MSILLSAVLFSCSENKQSNNTPLSQSTVIDTSIFFPVTNGSIWSISGTKMTPSGKILEHYKIQAGINDIRDDNGKKVVSFFRIGTPQKYSNDGPEEYYIDAKMVTNEDGFPILKSTMKKGEIWTFPTSGNVTAKLEVVDINVDFSTGKTKYPACIVIKIIEYDINRVKLLTFAPRIGLVFLKVYSGSSDISKASAVYVETRD